MPDHLGDDGGLGGQLLAIARDAGLRRAVYGRLGEYCHQCRNRLNSLKLSLYLARRGATEVRSGGWDELDARYQELEKLVERVQIICRPMALSRVTLSLDLLIDDRRAEWTRLLHGSGGDLVFLPPAEATVASFDVDRLGSALDALVAWRAGGGAAGKTARLRWWAEAGHSHLLWEEDGRNQGEDADPPAVEDRSWTLPFVARVIEAHGGDFRLKVGHAWRLDLSWPATPPQFDHGRPACTSTPD